MAAQLRALTLSCNRFSAQHCAALVAPGVLGADTHLDLGGCDLGEQGAHSLAAPGVLGALVQLQTLQLGRNELGDDGVAALLAPGVLGALAS